MSLSASRFVRIALLIGVACLSGALVSFAADTLAPAVGDTAADFQLKTPAGAAVELKSELKKGPVVLVVLRGYPGYQCPLCTVQVGKLLNKAKEIAAAKTSIVFVYPGPAQGLKEHADEFMKGKTLPENVSLAIDPDYAFTNAYGLRWNAKGETAYPSTFVIDAQGKIAYAKISKSHGGRAEVDDVLQAVTNTSDAKR